jgi:outer membrane protein TolC
MRPSSRGVFLCVTCAIILLPVPSRAEPLPLRSIVELALSHATAAATAAADEQHAAAAYQDLRDSYIPQITLGAGLGPPSYGFPLSLEGQPPSLFNINAQSSLWNPSLRQFLKAAKVDATVATLRTKDQRNQIIQDAAQSYAELAKWEQRLQRLRQSEEDENKMEAAVAERV